MNILYCVQHDWCDFGDIEHENNGLLHRNVESAVILMQRHGLGMQTATFDMKEWTLHFHAGNTETFVITDRINQQSCVVYTKLFYFLRVAGNYTSSV